jgi:hypothetical protein
MTNSMLLRAVALSSTIITGAWAQDNQRPLSDFINAQGASMCFTPPAPDQLGWGTGANKTNGNANLTPPRFALIDYTGAEAKYLLSQGIDLGTTVAGSVRERPMADGRALVTVDLQTKNALGWAIQNPVDFNADPLVFGSRVLDVVAGKTPALGDSHFHVAFTNSAPAAPLPDLICVNAAFCPAAKPCPPGFEIDFLQEVASISGPLHAPLAAEGTPGQLKVTQVGLNNPVTQKGLPPGCDPSKQLCGPLWDAFPVESIDLRSIGR